MPDAALALRCYENQTRLRLFKKCPELLNGQQGNIWQEVC